MSKDPIYVMGNVQMEQLTIHVDPTADPYGLQLPTYATAPDPATNNPGTIIFNSTTNAMEMSRNDGTYVPLAFGGAVPSGDIILESYAADGSAPAVNGSIYLNTTAFPGTIRYRTGGAFTNLLSTTGGTINTFSTQFSNLPTATGAGEAVEYDQFVAAPFLADTSTLNSIATAHPTTADISMNSHKLTGLTSGANPGEAVEFSQLSGFYANTVPLQSITLATGDVNVNSHKITNLTAGSASGNAVEYDQFVAVTNKAFGGAQDTNTNTALAVTNGTWATLVAPTQPLPANLFTVGSNFTLTFNGATASTPVQVTLNVSLSQDQATNTILITLFKNGSLYSNGVYDVLQRTDAVLLNNNVSMSLSTTLLMSPGDYIQPAVTLVGSSGNIAQRAVQFMATQL